jgi:hypothetical protein
VRDEQEEAWRWVELDLTAGYDHPHRARMRYGIRPSAASAR